MPVEDRLFIFPAFQQADETTFGWPDLRSITGLEGANRAIECIVEQGGGRPPIDRSASVR
jgi:hypothetical protein